MFVDAKTVSLFGLALWALSACAGPAVVPARPATEAEVHAVQVAEATLTRGRATALDPARPCPERAAGADDAVAGARRICAVAERSDDRDLDTRCATARTGAREARAATCLVP